MSESKQEVNKQLLRIREIGNKTDKGSSKDELNHCIDAMMHEIDGLIEALEQSK